MFTKTLKIIQNELLIHELKVILVLNKPHLFLPEDRFILFGSQEIKKDFSAPRKSELYLDNILIGLIGASGSLKIKSDRFNGILHAIYLT